MMIYFKRPDRGSCENYQGISLLLIINFSEQGILLRVRAGSRVHDLRGFGRGRGGCQSG